MTFAGSGAPLNPKDSTQLLNIIKRLKVSKCTAILNLKKSSESLSKSLDFWKNLVILKPTWHLISATPT